MKELYNEELIQSLQKTKKKMLTVYLVITGIVVLLITGVIIYYSTRPYEWKYGKLVQWLTLIFIGIYSALSFLYLEIPFGRVNKYYKLMADVLYSDKTESDVTFINFNKNVTQKYGVDFYYMNVLEWSEIEKDYVERSVMVDNEQVMPDFEKGHMFRIYTYSNILYGYTEDLLN